MNKDWLAEWKMMMCEKHNCDECEELNEGQKENLSGCPGRYAI